MDLSPEDALRLNVMLANKPQAIRIDESRMILHALSENGEARISLNPNCRDDQYIKKVRELLSGHVLGTPTGYPVYIQRWTRMGQMRNESLDELLLLGEPEAVVAVVYAAGLSGELARRAWWAMEEAENARQMLQHEVVVESEMGPVLAAYLIEFLPFETEPEKIMESIRLVLQGNLVSAAVRLELWKKAKRKSAMYIGFLAALPDDLPEKAPPHQLYQQFGVALESLAETGNPLAGLLTRVLRPEGQSWLATVRGVLGKPVNQDVVNAAMELIADYFSAARPEGRADMTLDELRDEAQAWYQAQHQSADLAEIIRECPGMEQQLVTLRFLSGMGYGTVRPVFSKSDAIGSLMRRKLEPITLPLLESISLLEQP